MTIDDLCRNFAQGLIVAAVDATCQMGIMHAVYDSVYLRPPVSLKKAFVKFSKKAMRKWFKCAKPKDIAEVRIYEYIKTVISATYGKQMYLMSIGAWARNNKTKGMYLNEPNKQEKVWCL